MNRAWLLSGVLGVLERSIDKYAQIDASFSEYSVFRPFQTSWCLHFTAYHVLNVTICIMINIFFKATIIRVWSREDINRYQQFSLKNPELRQNWQNNSQFLIRKRSETTFCLCWHSQPLKMSDAHTCTTCTLLAWIYEGVSVSTIRHQINKRIRFASLFSILCDSDTFYNNAFIQLTRPQHQLVFPTIKLLFFWELPRFFCH